MDDDVSSDLLLAVRQQMDSPRTGYVAETFRRLTSDGIPEQDALEQIAICLAQEMGAMTKHRRAFDEAAYQAALKNLPLPETEN